MCFPHIHRKTVIPITSGGTGEEGTGPFWETPMKSQDNLTQTTHQKTVGSPVIPLRIRGVLPLFLLCYNSVYAGTQIPAAQVEQSLTLPFEFPILNHNSHINLHVFHQQISNHLVSVHRYNHELVRDFPKARKEVRRLWMSPIWGLPGSFLFSWGGGHNSRGARTPLFHFSFQASLHIRSDQMWQEEAKLSLNWFYQ